jgi:hypothetical protein
MNNEPVAWMHKEATSWAGTFIHPETEPDEWMPLYTHPAKTLTDEEIDHAWFNYGWGSVEKDDLVKFARAILRKAQEK